MSSERDHRLDTLARAWATPSSRRGFFGAGLAAAAAAFFPGASRADRPPCTPGGTCTKRADCCPTERCVDGACRATTGADPASCVAAGCPASPDPCVVNVCNQGTGACEPRPAPDGTFCDDGDACTQTDVCRAGACVGLDPVVCLPLAQCHDAGACDPATGRCTDPPTPDGTPCDDGDPCTHGDVCAGGACVGTAYACVPSECQTGVACDGQGGCIVENEAPGAACGEGPRCQDGVATAQGTCDGAGACVPGAESSCAPYACGATACLAACAGDEDCAAGHYCAGTACLPQLPAGEDCAGPTACQSGICVEGVCCADERCTPACPAGRHDCGDGCVDLASHRWNCGACGAQCGNYEHCRDGSCVCEAHPEINQEPNVCGDTCTDLSQDRWNCGECGAQCGNYGHCREGACVCEEHPEINRDPAVCADSCTDLGQDRWNCGACGRHCGDQETCRDGVCTGACPDGTVDVRAFGAIGDGKKNDWKAIQDAIDAAAGGGTVCIPAGTYLVEDQLTLPSGVTLRGTRPGSRLEYRPTYGSAAMLLVGAATNVAIRGLVLVAAGPADFGISVNPPSGASTSDVTVEDCEISGFGQSGIRSRADRASGSLVTNLRIVGNHLHDIALGGGEFAAINPNGSDGTVVAGNLVEDVGVAHTDWGCYAVDSTNLTVAGNTFRGCSGGIAIGGNLALTGIAIRDNVVDGTTNPAHIGINLTGGAQAVVAGNRLAGAIIRAASCADSEIRDNILDLGQLGLGESAGILLGVVGAERVTVTGNQIANGSVAGDRPDRGIRVLNGADLTIAQNAISQVFDGVMAGAGPGASIRGVTIEGNTIRDTGGIGSTYVSVAEAQDIRVLGNDCAGGEPAFGIAIQGTTTSTIRVVGNLVGPGPTALAVQVSDDATDVQVLGNLWRNADGTEVPVPDLVR